MHRFFISPEQIAPDNNAVLKGPELHHLRTVMRLGAGDQIILFDGLGNEFLGRILSMGKEFARVALLEKAAAVSDSPLSLALAQGYLKDRKMDEIVRRITELGVKRWIPFKARRSVPVPDQRRLKSRYQRWQKIALEALKQCRRSKPLAIDPVAGFDDILLHAQPYDLKVLFWEKAGSPMPSSWPGGVDKPSSVLIVIGPEGGFENAEATAAQQQGFHLAGLGPRALRSETAAVSACTLIQYLFGDMGCKESSKDGHHLKYP